MPAQKAEAKGIEIERTYLDSKGEPVQNVNQGEELTVKIAARAMTPRIENCVISDLLPGGFEMVIPRGDEAQSQPAGVKHTNRREDRMLIFADLTNQPLTFIYRIRAVNRGMFTVPPVQAEAMYDQNLYGHGASESVEVR